MSLIYSKKKDAENYVNRYNRITRESNKKLRTINKKPLPLLRMLMVSKMSKTLKEKRKTYKDMSLIVDYFNRFPGSKMYQPQDMVIPPIPGTPSKNIG